MPSAFTLRFPLRCAAAVLSAAPLLTALPSSAHQKAHAHGVATMDVAVEARSISIQFSSPLDNLVGFERAPRNDPERRLADAAVARLNAADTVFKIDPAAQCKLEKVDLTSAALKLGAPDASAEPGHADLDGTFDFTCADAAKARYIDVGLFEFKRMRQIDVQVAAPAGQLKRSLRPSATRLQLSR